MTPERDLPFQPANFLCSLSTGHAATRSFIPFLTPIGPQLLVFDVPRLLQSQGFTAPVAANSQIASAIRHSYASLAAPKSP